MPEKINKCSTCGDVRISLRSWADKEFWYVCDGCGSRSSIADNEVTAQADWNAENKEGSPDE